jgi:flagellar basal-body rod protein FlgC
MFGQLDISTSGMVAQRTRLDAISANLANANTLLDSDGNLNPFRRREVFLAPGNPTAQSAGGRSMGVHVAEIEEDPREPKPTRYDPTSPFAFKDGPYKGYVAETGINSVTENINAVEAVRAYEANVMAAEATKQMLTTALRLLA